jgi:hypothetical protein
MSAESNPDRLQEQTNENAGNSGEGEPVTPGFKVIKFLKYFLWLFYLSRISLISAVAGILIFVFTLQARDLFLEVRSSLWMERTYWCLFYFLLVFAWLLPMYFSAIYMIEWCGRQPGTKAFIGDIAATKVADQMRKWVPLILVFCCLAALGWSQYKTWSELNRLFNALTQEQRQYITALQIPNTVLLIQATMLAGVLFLSSRAVLAFQGKMTRKYFFYSIGMAVGVLVIWFFWFSPHKEVLLYLSNDDKKGFLIIGNLPLLQWLRLCFPFFVALLWIFTYAGFFRFRHTFPDREDVVLPTIALILLALFALMFINPLWVTRYAERALLLPVVLGVWVPLFSVLSIASARTGLPIVLSFLVIIAIVSMTNKAHVITTADKASRAQLQLDVAIDTWKRANGCANYDDGDGCPPLILVAAQGGASRSAFFTGSVLGHILDENGIESEKRIFALSGVSGGSVGLAFFSAALIDRERSKQVSPCQTLSTLGSKEQRPYLEWSGFQNWFGAPLYYVEKEEWLSKTFGLPVYRDETLSDPPPYSQYWRNCLQVLASGDFISPVFLRLSGTDFLGFNRILGTIRRSFGADRGIMLEKAWEQHYHRIVGTDTLSRKFLEFAPNPASPDEWKPLLLLNATSTATGRRVIASHLYPWYCDGNGWKRRIFNDAYDLHEVFSANSAGEGGYDDNDCTCVELANDKKDGKKHVLQCTNSGPKYDFKLSMAASLSSRFPVLSPQADLVAHDAGEKVLARVVDGGYFENFGATSLFDLVTAIKWLQPKLPIHVILITNDPTFGRGDCLEYREGKLEDQRISLPDETNYQFWSGLRSIVSAVLETRGARGANAAINLCKLRWTFNQVEFTHIGVKRLDPKIEDISMNWWLSYPVQLYLDRQIGNKIIFRTPRTLEDIPAPVKENQEGFEVIRKTLHQASRSQ